MKEKVCFKCDILKPLSDFYKHKQMGDGHLNKCKSCTKRDVHIHREENLEKVREYDRNRPNYKERLQRNKEYAKTTKGKEASAKSRDNYRYKHVDRYKAKMLVGNALRDISKKFPELIEAELNSWELASKEINQVYKLASKFIYN